MGHPCPLRRRDVWHSLDGVWDFAIDHEAKWETPAAVPWSRTIKVPFAPETEASGIADTGLYRGCWYRKSLENLSLTDDERLLLHFGAVDYCCTVWVNNQLVASHEGGYTPFEVDITKWLVAGQQTIAVGVGDDPGDLEKPRGKQDWQADPHSIWYPRTTGIWQTVWMEKVPDTYIADLQWTPNVERWEVGFEARLKGIWRDDISLQVELKANGAQLAKDRYRALGNDVQRRIVLTDPGIDDYRNDLLWSPSTPTLIDAVIELIADDETVIDRVFSYCALRSLGIQGDRFVLNGRPVPLVMVLDQGYWPASGLTAPDDDALRRDVELAKAMGFNGVRKHQKIECSRYLYWADVLGLLVWEEMPSAYRFTRHSVERLTMEWPRVIARDRSHPCVVAWVPLNESWGVPDLPDSPAQRHYVQMLYHLTKTLDPTRPVIGNDGWESVATDIIGIHDYDDNAERMRLRYAYYENFLERERPGGRQLLVGVKHEGQPIMLTEFGGIAFSQDLASTWGYSRSMTVEDFGGRYKKLLEALRSIPALAGFCYTQFADTYQETNGLLYSDRRPKIPLEEIALANRGSRSIRDTISEPLWREQMMFWQRQAYRIPEEDRPPRGETPA
jgi:beta-galactosidase/beta-glucuronidase